MLKPMLTPLHVKGSNRYIIQVDNRLQIVSKDFHRAIHTGGNSAISARAVPTERSNLMACRPGINPWAVVLIVHFR